MATYTANYAMIKPSYADVADVAAINQNADTIDEIMHGSQTSIADAYNPAETYAAGDLAMHDFQLYKCNTDDTTGTWDPTKWDRTTAAAEGGGGGGSAVSITPTLSTGTKIADFEIDGVPGELYAPTGGGGGGGGSSQTVADIIWSGSVTPPTTGTDITLNHAISDYDFIAFTVNQNSGYDSIIIIPVNELTIGESYIETGYGGSQMDVYFDYTSDTIINIKNSASADLTTYTKITGLKFCGTLAPMIYSTEEREVGAWIDNKPLYQKSYELGTTIEITSSGANIESYIDNLTDIECFIGGESAYTGATSGANGKQGTAIFVGYVNGVLKAYCAEGTVSTIITLRYTKTADAPGSGSYGALGVPMEHYDSTERVVGTYFGDTLYKKTIRQTNINGEPSDWTLIETMSDVGEFVKSEANFKRGNMIYSQYYVSIMFDNSTKGLYYYIREMGSGARGDLEVTIFYTKSTT